MATLTLSLNSQNRWLADGTTEYWDFNFAGGYIDRAHVKAFSLSPTDVRADLTIESFTSDFRVRITPAVTNGYTLVIYRDSSNGGLPLVDFADGSDVDEASLDILAKQAVFLSQETRDSYGLTTESTFTDLLVDVQASAAAAASSATGASSSLTSALAAALAASNSASAASASAAEASATALDLLVTAGGLTGLKVIPVSGLPDWTDITTELQAAATAGGRWYLPKGKYEWTYITAASNFLLVGSGDDTWLRRKANTDPSGPSAAAAIGIKLTTPGIRVGIFDTQLDGNEANQSLTEPFGYLAGFFDLAPTATQVTRLDIVNCTLRNMTQAAVRADKTATSLGKCFVSVIGNTFIDGKPGTAKGTTSVNGYGPDAITVTDGVYLTVMGNTFIDTRTLAPTEFGRTGVRITFSDGTTNEHGARVIISSNFFMGYGRGERGMAYRCLMTGGSGSGAVMLPTAISGGAVTTFAILEGGSGYTAGNVLTHAGGLTVTVSTVSTNGRVLTATLTGGGAGYTLVPRPDNDVGVVDFYARGRDMIVTNNTFEDCVGTSVRGKTNCKQTIVTSNIMLRCETNPAINIGPNSYVDQQGRIVVTQNVVEECGGFGIAVVGNNVVATGDGNNTRTYVEDVIVSHNIVRKVYGWNINLNPVDGYAYRFRHLQRLIFDHNIGEGCPINGVNVFGFASTGMASIKLGGNIFENIGDIGISTAGTISGKVTVTDNLVLNAGNTAFHLECGSGLGATLVATGNQSDGSVDYGMRIRYWDMAVLGQNQITDVTGASRGFYAQDCVTAVLLADNQTSGVTTPLFGGGTAQNVVHESRNSWNPKVIYGTAAPTTNTWNRGDRIINSSPSAGGTEGWICTTAGTPGTWKTFGTIAA